MRYTPEERKNRILKLALQDENFKMLRDEYWTEKTKFSKFVDHLPKWIRQRLYAWPTTGYHLYHSMLRVVSEQMQFPDETEI